MTWGRWVELVFGAIIPTIVWGGIAVIALGAAVAGFFGVSVSYGWVMKTVGLAALCSFLVPVVGGLVAMWFLVLYGVEQVNHRPILRWFSMLLGIVAVLFGVCMLVESRTWFVKDLMKDSWTTVLGTISIVGPMIVGLRYLPRLIRGNK